MSPENEGNQKIMVENVNLPGHTHLVDGRHYHAMANAMLKALPDDEPGMNQAEMRNAILPHLPEDLFPGGAKAGWWSKTVQLDLEAKGILVRESTRPLRWHIKKNL